MNSFEPAESPANSPEKPEAQPPIKLPNPSDEIEPETPKVGSRDAPGG